MNYIYIHVKKGCSFKPGSLVPSLAECAHYIILDNGNSVGKLVSKNAFAVRNELSKHPEITFTPADHRPLKQDHCDAFNEAGILLIPQDDTAYDVGEKLHAKYGIDWLHPENWFIDGGVGTVDTVVIHADNCNCQSCKKKDPAN